MVLEESCHDRTVSFIVPAPIFPLTVMLEHSSGVSRVDHRYCFHCSSLYRAVMVGVGGLGTFKLAPQLLTGAWHGSCAGSKQSVVGYSCIPRAYSCYVMAKRQCLCDNALIHDLLTADSSDEDVYVENDSDDGEEDIVKVEEQFSDTEDVQVNQTEDNMSLEPSDDSELDDTPYT
ncbi:hypothetical protein J6590_081412 [Homalodisca vitripennis]|nr:hypothetical protein J6590_081412 [Homalodisca vitripennis]